MFKDKEEVIFFKSRDELIKKIIFYLKTIVKEKIAKKGCHKYHKKYSNLNVARYILNELNLVNSKLTGSIKMNIQFFPTILLVMINVHYQQI